MWLNAGGEMSGFATNSLLSVNGMPLASFNEPGNPESVVIERNNEDRFVDMGKGIVDGFKQRRGDYVSLQASGVEKGINTLVEKPLTINAKEAEILRNISIEIFYLKFLFPSVNLI